MPKTTVRNEVCAPPALMSTPVVVSLVHDLKMPLQAVLGWVSLLRHHRVDSGRVDEVLGIIERNSELLTAMVDELLEAAQTPGSELPLHLVPVNLVDLARSAVDALRPAAEEKSIALEMTGDHQVIVRGDAPRLMRVMTNLLANAIKFSPSGGVVQCTVLAGGRTAQVIVRDRGRGIGAEFLRTAFDPFTREDAGRVPGGVGLGLSVVRHIVQLHGGRVRADSEGPDRGATFTVTLPREIGEGSAISAATVKGGSPC